MMSSNKLAIVIWAYFVCTSSVRALASCPALDICARKGRYDCLPDTIDKSNCPPQCNKCPIDFPLVRQCQTAHRACILKNRNVFSGVATKSSCESVPGRVWCDGDTEKICVESQPMMEECFKRIDLLKPCGGNCTGYPTVQSCHINGCVWCADGTAASKNRCFQKNANIGCPNDTCCYQDTCLAGNFTVEECSDKCAEVCTDVDSNVTRCNFPKNYSTVVDETKWSMCTRKCGCGTQYRLVNCTNKFDPNSCEKVFRSCNTHDCELPKGYCEYGVRARYNDLTMCCANHTHACGRNPLNENFHHKRSKRVVGGINVTDPYKWSWVGALYTNVTHSSKNKKCTVTLVGDCWVVTTVTCTGFGNFGRDGLVHLGNPNRAVRPKHQSKISAFHISGDVILLKLTTPVPLKSLYISPLCIPNGEEPLPNRRCVVVGWGQLSGQNAACTATLQEGNIKILPWRMCEDAWSNSGSGGSFNSSLFICAGIPEGEIDACVGDEGGPLMCQRCENCGWYLAGLATKYLGCGVKAKPSVYVKMAGDPEHMIKSLTPALDNSTYSSCPPIYSL